MSVMESQPRSRVSLNVLSRSSSTSTGLCSIIRGYEVSERDVCRAADGSWTGGRKNSEVP